MGTMARRRSDAEVDPRRRILEAAEGVLRRHGPAKTTVVEVARVLGQTHASVYKHFDSKAALFDALIEAFLAKVVAPLEAIAAGDGPAADRLRAWLIRLMREKVRKVRDDPEYFAAYQAIVAEARDVADRHVRHLAEMLGEIIASGVAAGEFRVADPRAAGRAVQNATLRFHHPALLAGGNPPPDEAELEAVVDLLVAGLRAGVL